MKQNQSRLFDRAQAILGWKQYVKDGVLTIPEGYTTLEDQLFCREDTPLLKGIHTVRLPATLEEIGASAFNECSDLKEITLPAGVTTIGKAAFFWCNGLEEIQIPAGVSLLPGFCFSGCRALYAVHFSEGLTHIERWAFSHCHRLKSLTLPQSLATLDEGVFEHCLSLERVVLPPLLKTLPLELFSNCRALKEVILPQGLLRIEEKAFWGCTGLEKITIPATVEFIHPHAFCFCGEQLRLHFAPGCKVAGYTPLHLTDVPPFQGLSVQQGVLSGVYEGGGELSLPEGVFLLEATYAGYAPTNLSGVKRLQLPSTLELGSHFAHSPNLTQVSISPGFRELEPYAFEGCTALTDVHLSEGLLSIGQDVFRGCTALRSITLPASVTEVDSSLFREMEVRTTPGGWITFEDGMYKNRKTKALLFCPRAKDGEVTIPPDVTVIAENAFARCQGLTRLVVPAHVEGMEFCRWQTKDLTQVVLEGETIQLHSGMFRSCTALRQVTLPKKLTEAGALTFAGCTSLEEIELPPTLLTLDFGCFESCHRLKNLTIPQGVTKIGWECFAGCRSLQTLAIPPSVVEIAEDAFEDCPQLELLLEPGSYAEQYARENSLPHRTCGE